MASKTQRRVNKYVRKMNKKLASDEWLIKRAGVWSVKQFRKEKPFRNSEHPSDHKYETFCFYILKDGKIIRNVWFLSELEIIEFNKLYKELNREVDWEILKNGK